MNFALRNINITEILFLQTIFTKIIILLLNSLILCKAIHIFLREKLFDFIIKAKSIGRITFATIIHLRLYF